MWGWGQNCHVSGCLVSEALGVQWMDWQGQQLALAHRKVQ